jgi:predicted DNA-binding transcriptional regulator AlpA
MSTYRLATKVLGMNKGKECSAKNEARFAEFELLRLSTVLKLIPVSKSAWWQGVKEGRFPQPLKLGPRTTVWRAEDLRKLIAHGCDVSRKQ